jgi:hypothetical protein
MQYAIEDYNFLFLIVVPKYLNFICFDFSIHSYKETWTHT